MPGPTFAYRTLLLLSLLAAACGKNVYLDDDEGAPQPQSGLAAEHPDHLSLPYALGTTVHIGVSGGGGEDQTGWQLTSAAPAVLTVNKVTVTDKRLVADCTAAGAGEARIQLLDSGGAERRAATVTVKAADRARVLAHGPLRILGREETSFTSAEVHEARVLVGSKGVFALAYYLGEERLYGRGIATMQAPVQVQADNQTTQGVATNEWLAISPLAAGSFDLKIVQGGRAILTLPVVGAAEAEIASLTLSEEHTDSRSEDQQLWVLAQARDSTGRDIHGVYSDWTLGGVTQLGQNGNAAEQKGDLYRYNYASAASAMQDLVATRGAARASLSVHASKGYVANTTYLGCSAAPATGAPVTPGAFGLLLCLAVLLVARRSASVRSAAP